MYEVKGRFFWDNGVRMKNVLIVSESRFEFFVKVADGDVQFESLDIIPTPTLPHSEAIYVSHEGDVQRMIITDKD